MMKLDVSCPFCDKQMTAINFDSYYNIQKAETHNHELLLACELDVAKCPQCRKVFNVQIILDEQGLEGSLNND